MHAPARSKTAWMATVAALIVFTRASAFATRTQIAPDEYGARRARLMDRFADGIVILHARPVAAGLTDHGFKQDAAFFYFTGLANQPSAILAVDGVAKESFLFVPEPPQSFGVTVEGVSLEPLEGSWIRDWNELTGYLTERVEAGARLYLDEPRRPETPGNPKGLRPVAGDHLLFRLSLEEAFPGASFGSAASAIREMRWVKSDAEVAVLRDVARASAEALREGIRAVEPGVRQRASEAAVVSGCLLAGAEGPSFWPWTMAGRNAHTPRLVRSFYDYEHLDREMLAGELVRIDVGCDLGHYEGDVGRTVPVSGSFSERQAEAWNLLIAGYRGGLAAMRAGATRAELAEASRRAVRSAEPALDSDYARRAARAMLEGGDAVWHLHGVGLEAGEERVDPLRAGAVVAYEPGFSVDEDAYYLEDMILITQDGHEVLSVDLPYTADEIARMMRGR